MLDCFSTSFRQSSSDNAENHRLTSQAYSAGTTPRSHGLSSPNINHRFNKLIHTPSFLDIKIKISAVEEWENGDIIFFLKKVIEPNPEHIQNILTLASSNPFTHHLTPYFTHTEQVCHLLLKLEKWVHHTHRNYTPINKLIQNLPDSLNQEQCGSASQTLVHFKTKQSHNPCSRPHNLNNMHTCSYNLKEHINGCRAENSKNICFIGSVIKLAIASLKGLSFSTVPKLSKKDLAYIGLLDKAANSALILDKEVQTIELLAQQLQTYIESDLSYISMCDGRGDESFLVSKVVNNLAKSSGKISGLLDELEDYICRCFKDINNVRCVIIRQIHQVHQSL